MNSNYDEWILRTFTYYDTTAEEWSKNVGEETSKSFKDKFFDHFWYKYCNGEGLDIGGRGYINSHAVLPTAKLVDLDYPGYDGRILPFLDKSQDYLYSSHCLEHISDRKQALQEWFRVVKPGGHLIIVVPHSHLYERKESLPSRWNEDHKVFFTPAVLLKELEEALSPNAYRIRHMQDNDKDHDYNQPVTEHAKWLYEIEVVLEKLS